MNNKQKDIKSRINTDLIQKYDVESMRTFLSTQQIQIKGKFLDSAKERIVENIKKFFIKYSSFDN